MIPKPATRRLRHFAVDCRDGKATVVYVGPNPVIKKTIKMLRKQNSGKLKRKEIPRSTSKKQLKQSIRKLSANSLRSADIPKAPCRKPSNTNVKNPDPLSSPPSRPRRQKSKDFGMNAPFLNAPVMTRSHSIILSHDMPLRLPCRKPSNPDMQKTRPVRGLSFPISKKNNPFLRDLESWMQQPVLTRSQSKRKLAQTLLFPSFPTRDPAPKPTTLKDQKKVSFMDLEWSKMSM